MNLNTNNLHIKKPSNFNLNDIFSCGQCFRFNRIDNNNNIYCGVAFSKYLKVEQTSDSLVFYNTTQEDFDNIWQGFFDLSTDYGKIIDTFCDDEHLYKAANTYSGIRILRQEMWETLLSFIISQNNNIPRIKGIIENISKKYGTPIGEFDGQMRYSFPTPEVLFNAGVDEIFALKTGFRAKYIFDAAKKVYQNEINLEEILKMNTQDAMQELMKIKGVGPKVALCTLLFGFGKHDAFPVDVWVKKVLSKYYSEKPSIHFEGQNAGIAQQYLFYYERCINNITI